MRQAVVRLLWFPAIAQAVSAGERNALDRVQEPGIELLRELIDNLRAHPAQLPAQVVERWADRPERDSLEKLLFREEVITDAAAAAGELRAALLKLGELADSQLFEALKAKAGSAGMDSLDAAELVEFKRLATRRPGGGPNH